MAEMSLERIAERLNETRYLGRDDWGVDEGQVVSEGHALYLSDREARDAASLTAEMTAKEISEACETADRDTILDKLRDGRWDALSKESFYHTGFDVGFKAGVAWAASRLAAPPAERAGGRPEAGQLSGDSGQLGAVVGYVGAVIAGLPDGAKVTVKGEADYPVSTVSAGALRALLAAAERGPGAEAGPASLGLRADRAAEDGDAAEFVRVLIEGFFEPGRSWAQVPRVDLDRLLALLSSPGRGTGPATRYVMERLRRASETSPDPNYFAIHAEHGGQALAHLKHKTVALALRECGLEEPAK